MKQALDIQQYAEDGFCHLTAAMAPDAVNNWRKTILDAAAKRPNMSSGNEYVAVFEPGSAEPKLDEIIRSPTLASIAAGFLGHDQVRLFAGAAYIKPAGGVASFWHQDLWFFPINDTPVITVWLPLTAIAEDQAPMIYAQGSHKAGFCSASYDEAPKNIPLCQPAPMALGDILVHDGWTLHGSADNRSGLSREAIGLVYIPDGARFATRQQLESIPDRFAMLSGYINTPAFRAGELITGTTCPLVSHQPCRDRQS